MFGDLAGTIGVGDLITGVGIIGDGIIGVGTTGDGIVDFTILIFSTMAGTTLDLTETTVTEEE